MKILCIFTAYNEIEFLKHKKQFCDYHGLDMYVVDNYSNDGTWEWLQDNKVSSHRLDTNECFDILKLQAEANKVIHSIQPDWVLYNGADTFPFCSNNIKIKDIINNYQKHFNVIPLPTLNIRNTGEQWAGNYFQTYYHADPVARRKLLLFKYCKHYRFIGDDFHTDNMRFANHKNINFLQLNYGAAKPKHIQEERYKRRQKAWLNGLARFYGEHYTANHNNKYIYSKDICLDIRSIKKYKIILESINTIFKI